LLVHYNAAPRSVVPLRQRQHTDLRTRRLQSHFHKGRDRLAHYKATHQGKSPEIPRAPSTGPTETFGTACPNAQHSRKCEPNSRSLPSQVSHTLTMSPNTCVASAGSCYRSRSDEVTTDPQHVQPPSRASSPNLPRGEPANSPLERPLLETSSRSATAGRSRARPHGLPTAGDSDHQVAMPTTTNLSGHC